MGTEYALLVVAIGFAFVTGINDGGALLAPGLRLPSSSVVPSLLALVLATTFAPILLGTGVAETMLGGIVSGDSGFLVPIGFCVAIVVVLALGRAGLPTSLTLAVIGGLTGAGVGGGAAIDWAAIARILGLGVLAPIAGAVLGNIGSRLVRHARTRSYSHAVRAWHVIAFIALCLAYGMNDGQKVLVMFMLAAEVHAGAGLPLWTYAVAGIAFAVGTSIGLPRVARTIGTGILDAGPVHVVTAESAAAVAVFGSALTGSPVSMTQAVTGGLVGAGTHDGVRRVRWQMIGRVVLAWMATLPAAMALGVLASLLVGIIGSRA